MIPEGEECLLSQSRAGGCNCQDEGGDSEGGVDGDQGRAERGSRRLAAQQEDETEEANHKLEKKQEQRIY